MTEQIEGQETSQTPVEAETPQEPVSEPAEAPQQPADVRDEPQLLARTKKAEAEVKRLRETISKAVLGDEEKADVETPADSIDPLDAVADALGLIRDMKSEENLALREEAITLKISQADFIKSKAGQAYLVAFRREQEVARTTPPPSTKGVGADNAATEKPSRFPTVAEWKAEKAKKRGNE